MSRWAGNHRRRLIGVALCLLALQAVLTYGLARVEHLPSPEPLDRWPRVMAGLPASQDGVIDPEAYEMLSPDDILNRQYFDQATGRSIGLFVAYYKTQIRAKNAHDPKVCLPGSGWNPQLSDVLTRQFDADRQPATINRYVVAKGNHRNVVLYWYQTHKRSLAREQELRLFRMLDTIRDSRTDMALIRIIVPVEQEDVEAATKRGLAFADELYPHIKTQFPPTT